MFVESIFAGDSSAFPSTAVTAITVLTAPIYRVGQKTGLFLRSDNFATINE